MDEWWCNISRLSAELSVPDSFGFGEESSLKSFIQEIVFFFFFFFWENVIYLVSVLNPPRPQRQIERADFSTCN